FVGAFAREGTRGHAWIADEHLASIPRPAGRGRLCREGQPASIFHWGRTPPGRKSDHGKAVAVFFGSLGSGRCQLVDGGGCRFQSLQPTPQSCVLCGVIAVQATAVLDLETRSPAAACLGCFRV